jgi:hypothetical protein
MSSQINRATNAELKARRKEIQELIVRGVSAKEIKDSMSAKWNTSHRAIADDIRAINKEWEEMGEENRALNRNIAIERLSNLLLQSEKVNDALNVLKELHKIQGLYEEKEKEENKIPDFIKIGVVKPASGDEDSEQDTEH